MQSATRLILVFSLILISLFWLELLQPVQVHFIQPFTALIAKVSVGLIQLFDSNVISEGIVIRDLKTGSAVSIQSGCNGIEAMICLTAAVIAFPSTWRYRALGLAIGFLAIQLLNIVRIISLFYLLQWNQTFFEWAHLYLWQALIILDAFFVFILWLRYLPEPSSEAAQATT